MLQPLTSASDVQARRPRILISAFACRPFEGSESQVGWNRARQAARFCDVWVLCEETRNRPNIERWIAEHGEIPGLEFLYVPRKESWRWKYHYAQLGGVREWGRRAIEVVRAKHREIDFDLVHQLTWGSVREPGFLWTLDIPFVWGPLGGTHNFPARFTRLRDGWEVGVELARGVFNTLQLSHSPRVHAAAQRAALVLAASQEGARDIKRLIGVNASVMPRLGLDDTSLNVQRMQSGDNELHLSWAGGLRVNKALPLVLEALARLPSGVRWTLDVIGDGPMQSRWRRDARRLNIDDRITWHGQRSHRETLTRIAASDLFVFSSLRDMLGVQVIEALREGVPVVCLDHQGVADVVNESCGVKIPLTTPARVVTDLSDALARLARDAELRQQLSLGAKARYREFSFEHQGEVLRQMYRGVLGNEFLWNDRAALVRSVVVA